MKRGDIWTMTQAARALKQPQHKLIYLCQQGVVHPDVDDAQGRGSSRLFSSRNLLEFAVALELRVLQIPASALVAVVYVLRAFEGYVQRERPAEAFELPRSLQEHGAPDVRLLVRDGRLLYVSIHSDLDAPTLFGGIDLQSDPIGDPAFQDRERGAQVIEASAPPSEFGGPEGSRRWRVEISVTRLAQDLRSDA